VDGLPEGADVQGCCAHPTDPLAEPAETVLLLGFCPMITFGAAQTIVRELTKAKSEEHLIENRIEFSL